MKIYEGNRLVLMTPIIAILATSISPQSVAQNHGFPYDKPLLSNAGTKEISREVNSEIGIWKNVNKIEIDPATTRYIEQAMTSGTMGRLPPTSVRRITSAYLYEVRDTKELTGIMNRTIMKSDVETLPIPIFLEMNLKKDIGYLKVESTPTHGEIMIDGEVSGKTTKEFILSPGRYVVEVNLKKLRCRQSVNVVKNTFAKTTCPNSN